MPSRRGLPLLFVALAATIGGGAARILADCWPFTDVTAFCGPIVELWYLGIAGGTSPTTFAPNQPATRGETAAFVARSFNQSVRPISF